MSGTAAPAAGLSSGPLLGRASERLRLAVMLVVGLAAALVTGLVSDWVYAPLVGWDSAALVFTVWVWVLMSRFDATSTASHATRENPGRTQSDVIVLVAAVASLIAVVLVLVRASSSHGSEQDWLAALGLLSVVLSWSAVHTLFALRYARLYYQETPGGIDFKQDLPPRYLDFAYVAFTIGMTFQVSDTDIQTPAIRATALRQALLGYMFGAVILGGTINLLAGLAGHSG